MRVPFDTIALSFLLLTSTPTVAHPQPISNQLVSSESVHEARDAFTEADVSELWKRKGGGGGGGKGGSGGSSGSGDDGSGSSSSGSSSSGSSSSSSGYVPSNQGAQRGGGVGDVGEEEVEESIAERDVVSRGRSTPSMRQVEVANGEESPSLTHRPAVVAIAGAAAAFVAFARARGGGHGGHSGHGHEGKPKSDFRSSSSSSAGKGSTSSNTGGATKQGSGVQPSYGGGRYYGGGSTTPYRSGLASPLGLPAVFLVGSALAFYPGVWAYGAYGYNYHNPYTFRNHSATNSTSKRSTEDMWYDAVVRRQDTGVNETKPVTCLCAAYLECGCDDNGNTTFLDSLIGDGSYAALNKTLVDVANINGTSTIVLNGTLPNGTTTSGGTEDVNGARTLQASGYLVMIALVGCTVLLV